MGKTVNRMPAQVSLPSKNDVKHYFFNHYNWKGLNDDKNFLTVDQETFIESNNVYVDTEGLLKSRPSLKLKVAKYTNSGVEYTLTNILDVWTFENVTVYQTKVDDVYYLTFVNSNVDNHLQEALTYVDENNETQTYKNVKLIAADNKIFVFSEYAFTYYDIKENVYADAVNFIHIPVTNVITDGIAVSSVKVESPNALTTSYITKYLYTSDENPGYSNLIGETVTVDINGVTYSVLFEKHTEKTFVNRFTGITSANFSDEFICGKNAENIPLIRVARNGNNTSMLCCSYSYTIDNEGKPTVVWTVYHTIDGMSFTEITMPTFGKIVGTPILSKDGDRCIVFIANGGYDDTDADTKQKSDGPYITTLSSTANPRVWTNLLYTKNNSDYDDLKINLNEISGTNGDFNQSQLVNGEFIDDDNFVFTYANGNISQGDPTYTNFYCVYFDGSNIVKHTIFNATSSSAKMFASSPKSKNLLNMVRTTNGANPNYISNITSNIDPITFIYEDSNYNQIKIVLNDLQYRNWFRWTVGVGSSGGTPVPQVFVNWTRTYFTGKLTIYDEDDNILESKNIYFSEEPYAPVTYYNGLNISSYNSITFSDEYFTYKFESHQATDSIHNDNRSDAFLSNYYQTLTLTPKPITLTTVDSGTKLSISGQDEFVNTTQFVPNVAIRFHESVPHIVLDFIVVKQDTTNFVKVLYHIYKDDQNNMIGEVIQTYDDIRAPLRDSVIIDTSMEYKIGILLKDFDDTTSTIYIITENDQIEIDTVSTEIGKNMILRLDNNSLITDRTLYYYDAKYYILPLLFTAKPISYDSSYFYLATDNDIYVNDASLGVITIDKLTKGKINYFLPEHDSLLSNYYFSKDNTLYISSSAVKLNVITNGNNETVISDDKLDFEWYLPEINKETFDYKITNLHPISNTEMAIFFEHSISYCNWDNDVSAYRYYKSKVQTGCKSGCDVLTTYDGKFVIFTSERGLVALTSQEFMATTEQAITYLSDSIFNLFQDYITDNLSKNEVKLFKYAYWIMAYKQDSKQMFIFDMRNNSWWMFTLLHMPLKLTARNNVVSALLDNRMYDFDKQETNYYDYDGTKHKISWSIKSQKLHFNATNYYKHIVNLTFISVHDKQLLENAEYNVNSLDFKLQVNSYRKSVDGNINNENEYTVVEYIVESARTFVQRLNYSKVNEFQYLLSSDNETAISIPLSLNNITVKYKIGTQVR